MQSKFELHLGIGNICEKNRAVDNPQLTTWLKICAIQEPLRSKMQGNWSIVIRLMSDWFLLKESGTIGMKPQRVLKLEFLVGPNDSHEQTARQNTNWHLSRALCGAQTIWLILVLCVWKNPRVVHCIGSGYSWVWEAMRSRRQGRMEIPKQSAKHTIWVFKHK